MMRRGLLGRHASRKHDQALADMRSAAASLASSVGAMIPVGHRVTAEQLDKAAADLGRDFLNAARVTWREDGMSDEAITLIGPLVQTTFVEEFKTRLRAELPLHKLIIEGKA